MKHPEHSRSEHHSCAWGVHRCDCGQFTLKLGALRIDLTPDELGDLLRLLQKAAAHFEIEIEGEPEPAAPTTH